MRNWLFKLRGGRVSEKVFSGLLALVGTIDIAGI